MQADQNIFSNNGCHEVQGSSLFVEKEPWPAHPTHYRPLLPPLPQIKDKPVHQPHLPKMWGSQRRKPSYHTNLPDPDMAENAHALSGQSRIHLECSRPSQLPARYQYGKTRRRRCNCVAQLRFRHRLIQTVLQISPRNLFYCSRTQGTVRAMLDLS
jgi:hypothetical protein